MLAQNTSKFLTRAAFAREYGFSAATIDRLLLVDPAFPKPLRVSARKAYWHRDHIDAWYKLRQEECLSLRSIRGAATAARKARVK